MTAETHVGHGFNGLVRGLNPKGTKCRRSFEFTGGFWRERVGTWGVTTSPVAARTPLEPLIAVVAASPLHVSDRCQSPELGSYGAAYSGVHRVSRQLCTDCLFDL